jgi:DEAD/DEAH box helicase domain-containing protein
MCDPRDLSLHVQVKSPHFGRPTIFIYDTNAGGVGLSTPKHC